MPAKPTRVPNNPNRLGGASSAFWDAFDTGEELEGARLLPLDLIVANPYQPRQMFDDATLDELTQSIRDQGVLQPILVRPMGDRYQIVAGERRTRAADRAGLSAIPAIIRTLTDAQAVVATAAENLQRADLDLEDEARQYQYLMEVLGLSGRQLAERLGKGRQYVNNRLALLQHPDLLGLIRLGQLTQAQALAEVTARSRPDPVTSDEVVAVAHGVPLREDDSNNPTWDRQTERAVLDSPRPATGTPTAFRWRPLQQATTWLERTPPASVPVGERASVRAQLASMREQLEAWERALGDDDV